MTMADYTAWARGIDQAVFGSIEATIAGLPRPLAALLALAAILGMLAFGRLVLRGLASKAPPVFEGVPFIGGLIKFAQGPMKLMADGFKSCGEVFTVPLLHKNVTFLIGPHVSPHFFKATDDQLSQTEVYKFNVPTFGPGVVYDVDVKIRTEQIRFFAESLKTQKLRDYVPLFVKEAEDFFAKWGNEGIVDLKDEMSELIILTASRTLMGREVREEMFEQVSTLLHDLDDGMRPISVLFPYLPTAFHRKRDKARAELQRLFSKVIERRRASGEKSNDVLQTFIDSNYRAAYNGRATTNEEITGFLIATLFAGQHTSTISSSWTGYNMLNSKDTTWEAAQLEQRRVMAEFGNELSIEALSSMTTLHVNIQEAIRLFPPLIMLMRYVKETFSVSTSTGRQYVIPKGSIVAASPAFAHRLPEVFTQPDSYQPERYEKPREEDKKVPFSYIGFGGGRHGCLGQNFAYLQIKAIWSVLLRNFDMELIDPFPEPDYQSMVVGPKSCRIRYKRRKLESA